jgi:competence protein ComEC
LDLKESSYPKSNLAPFVEPTRKSRRHKRVVLITAFSAAFLSGLMLGHHWWRADLTLAVAATLLLLPARRSRLFLPLIVAIGLIIGIWRGYQSNFTYAYIDSSMYQKVTLTGRVADDPVINDRGHLIYSLDRLSFDGRSVSGTLRVRSHWAKLQRGYRIEAKGRLEPTLGSRQAQLGFAQVKVISTRQNWLERLRQNFFAGMRTALPEPLASLALGLLVGTRGLMPEDLQQQLTRVGLSHIVAVSGYNLTIIVQAVYRPLRRRAKFLSIALTLWLVGAFTLVSGFSPSIVRAAIVSTLSLAAGYYGRRAPALTVIALAAVLTTAYRPEYLWQDLGWQLSFLAFFGILVLAPAIEQRLIRRPNGFKKLLLESLSAQLMTFPLIMMVFDRLSLSAPLANLIVLPLIPVTMLSGFIAALAGVFVPSVVGWFAWPASLVIQIILAAVDWLAGQTWAEAATTMSGRELAAWYLIVALFLTILRRGTRAKENQAAVRLAPKTS